eukprot:CAMPEP_0204172478 /NCGR_PEP_ID=MMETSP0361-20130328/44139_1 /ASSEMBLY_ACC=CAM_ASM_000343 /TAXON_ID=268821 /ORGANISM="Scrippsiella Hangoei, Strain SHTV-5" /LENGTH=56 /DNA_ID=CAMNT_0051130567 /DNA_START=1001 /DNA_END=1168 /DNA_ORIENTATION=+
MNVVDSNLEIDFGSRCHGCNISNFETRHAKPKKKVMASIEEGTSICMPGLNSSHRE